MKTEDWKPDYGITKGYPFEQPVSKEKFKVRLYPIVNESGDVRITIDKKCYPDYRPPNWLVRLLFVAFPNFLLFRIFDYDQALTSAEHQIEDMLKDYPFIPEDFGFEKVFGPTTISDPPVSIYVSKFNNDISIFRGKDDIWTMLTKKGEGFTSQDLKFPCHRIAYATFHALQTKVEDKQFKEAENMKIWTATYLPEGLEEKKITVTDFRAIDEADAKSRASFLITTGIDPDIIVEPKWLSAKEKTDDIKLIADQKIVGHEVAN